MIMRKARNSFYTQAEVLLAGARTVLDMGTVGGERFSELLEGYDGLAVAT